MTSGSVLVTNLSRNAALVVGDEGSGTLRLLGGCIEADNVAVGPSGSIIVSNDATLSLGSCIGGHSSVQITGSILEFSSGSPMLSPDAIVANNAILSFRGATFGLAAGSYLVCDIGGGSTEFMAGSVGVEPAGPHADFAQELQALSLPLGVVRLTERFVRFDPIELDEIAAMENAPLAAPSSITAGRSASARPVQPIATMASSATANGKPSCKCCGSPPPAPRSCRGWFAGSARWSPSTTCGWCVSTASTRTGWRR